MRPTPPPLRCTLHWHRDWPQRPPVVGALGDHQLAGGSPYPAPGFGYRRGLLYATGMALWMGGAASQAQAKDLEEARKE